ncbi:hypothetical protein [Candidatus Lariskella endosymbiont of Epinotia ramella]|uniref:hypothetical protein n=1 Tax=Candidatus Lariskella endosymbiont of Epinotia ramella TaxID=3066224 RepID=UPI0030D581D7
MLFGQTCTNLTEDIVPLIETHLIVSIATSYMIYTAYGINNISNFGFISPALLRTAIYCAKEYSENLRAQELVKTIKQQSGVFIKDCVNYSRAYIWN